MFCIVVITSAILAVVQGIFIDKTSQALKNIIPEAGDIFEQLNGVDVSGTSEEHLKKLEDQVAMLEKKLDDQDQAALQIYAAVLPAILVTQAASLIISVLAFLLYARFMIAPGESALQSLSQALRTLPSACVLFLILAVASFLWLLPFSSSLVDILAGLLALIVLPRLLMSPALLVRDRLGIVGSIRTSIQKTRGQWLRIMQLIVVFGVIAAVVAFGGGFFALFLGGLAASLYVTLFLQYFVIQCIAVALASSLVSLAEVLGTAPKAVPTQI